MCLQENVQSKGNRPFCMVRLLQEHVSYAHHSTDTAMGKGERRCSHGGNTFRRLLSHTALDDEKFILCLLCVALCLRHNNVHMVMDSFIKQIKIIGCFWIILSSLDSDTMNTVIE